MTKMHTASEPVRSNRCSEIVRSLLVASWNLTKASGSFSKDSNENESDIESRSATKSLVCRKYSPLSSASIGSMSNAIRRPLRIARWRIFEEHETGAH